MASRTSGKPRRASASPNRELPVDLDALLTIDEVSRLLSVTPRWVRRAVARRYFASVRVGKLVRVRRRDLDIYLGSRVTPPGDGR
jgi:excisionase family DNA binding protein